MRSVVFLVKDLRVNGANRVILEFAAGLDACGWRVTLSVKDMTWSQWTGGRLVRCISAEQALTERFDVAISTFYTTIFDLDHTQCDRKWQIFQDNYYRYGQRTQDRLDRIEYSYLHRGSQKIVVSNYLAGILRAKGVVASVIHLGIDPRRFFPRPRPTGLSRPRVLIEGYPRPYKSLGEAYEAVPLGWEIWGFGVADHKLGAKRMFVLPAQEDIVHIYGGCEMFLKLEHGSFALAVLEAMAWGRPVVVSDEGGHFDYSINEFNALIVHSVDDAREALQRLADDCGLWAKLADNGIRVAREFTWPRAVAKLDRLLRRE